MSRKQLKQVAKNAANKAKSNKHGQSLKIVLPDNLPAFGVVFL